MSSAHRAIAEFDRRAGLNARRLGLSVEWHPTWSTSLSRAARALPLDGCSHDVLDDLSGAGANAHRYALVRRAHEPIAVIGLRRRGDRWTPATAQCLPFATFPAVEGWATAALLALDVPIIIPDVPAGVIEVDHPGVHASSFTPYVFDLETDLEALWKSTGYWRTISNIRNRTAHLKIVQDRPGAVDWIVDEWRSRWEREAHNETAAAADMAVVWNRLRDDGAIKTVELLDGDRVVAGLIALLQGTSSFAMCSARVDDLPKLSLGTRIIDASATALAERHVRLLDLGGYSNYKHRIAPAGATRYTVLIDPPVRRAVLRAAALAHRARRRFTAGARTAPSA